MATTRTHDLTTMTTMRARIALVAVTAVYLSAAVVMVASAFTPPTQFGSGSSSSLLPSRSILPTSSHIICHSHATPRTKTTTIRVCQNKHCRKRAQQKDILQTVHNLLDLPPPTSSTSSSSCGVVDIVSSGCLSECDKGPNLEVEVEVSKTYGDSPNKILLLHGMKDTQSCITQFNLLSASGASPGTADDGSDDGDSTSSNNSICFDHLKPNKVLIAASKVIEQANTLKKNDEKIRYLSSIIDTLDTKTSIQMQNANGNTNNRDADVASKSSYIDYTLSAVYAHAHASRAQAYVEMDRYDDAIQDAQRVVVSSKCSSAATPLSITLAYRSWVDAEYMKLLSEEQQEEQPPSGLSTMTTMMAVGRRRPLLQKPNTDTTRIRSVLQQWLIDQPTYRLKIEEELKNLPS